MFQRRPHAYDRMQPACRMHTPPAYDRNMQPAYDRMQAAYDRMQAACVPSVAPALVTLFATRVFVLYFASWSFFFDCECNTIRNSYADV